MKKLYSLYILEIIAFIAPIFFFKTDIESYIALGLVFILPIIIVILLSLSRLKEKKRIIKIVHIILLIISLVTSFILISFMTSPIIRIG
jgi:hypothetical protein